MTRPRSKGRVVGWLVAGAAALGLVGGAAAFAFAAKRRENALVLDLSTSPPAAPAIAVLSEAAPEITSMDPSLPVLLDPADAAPAVPDATIRPILTAAAPMSLPEIEPPVVADLSLPPDLAEPEASPKLTTRPKARPEAEPDPKPRTEPERETKKETKRNEPRPEEPARDPKSSSSASAPSAAAKVKGGDLSPAAYAKAVMKKVHATQRKSGAGKGTVVVGFTIAANGGLASVKIMQSSGNAELDAVAVDHIRRSAPFPPPVSNAGRGYSFQFIGK